MENNNRTILAIALIILLWSGYSLFFSPQPPVENTAAPEAAVSQQAEQAPVPAAPVTPSVEVAKAVLPADYLEQFVTVSSDLYDIKLSTTGATVREVILKQYRESNDPDAQPYHLLDFGSDALATFKSSGSEGLSLPADQPYQLPPGVGNTLTLGAEPKTISFSSTTASGLTIVKHYTFYPQSYQIDLKVELVNSGSQANKGVFNLSLVNEVLSEKEGGMQGMYTHLGPLSWDGKELLEDKLDDLEKSAKIYGDSIIWSGFTQKYFLSIINPQQSAKQIQILKGDGYAENRFVSPFISLEPGQKQSFDYVAFVGPLDFDLLESVGYQFEQAKDYGFFAVLAKPLMHVLKFFYGFLGNYGLAIILLTVCIKLIFWPLTQKSYKSMKGMQKLQPEMQKLREKYGHDKQRLNQEMMSFYKENKVNPLGGCLPMLIQIPVFFALYQVLLGAIELRHAPFMLWITDLSAKDPYYITPIIMGGTMFLQQKMTPTNMDPTQEKIMLMMPVVFTFLFLNFPSGLVVYWMVNNILTILQQYLIRRQPD